MIDRSAIRFHQSLIIILLLLSFVIDSLELLAITAAILFIGVWQPKLSLPYLLYRHIAIPIGLVHPIQSEEDPAPHRFAQTIGAWCTVFATVVLLLKNTVAGWFLVWVVIVLATINLVFGFCLGCFLYLQLKRIRTMFRPQ